MITFAVSCLLLIVAYVVYGAVLERLLGVDEGRPVPSQTMYDGVDYVPLPWTRAFLIQLLNIAGLGPVFGAVLGALFGPIAFLWIVFGGIFIGATHDFTAAFVSMRENGASLTELIGRYLGKPARLVMTALTLVLLMLVGVAFVLGPARIMADLCGSGEVKSATVLTPESTSDAPSSSKAATTSVSPTPATSAISAAPPMTAVATQTAPTASPATKPIYATAQFWAVIIFIYYILATLLPIDQLIGRIYPIFGAALLIMAGMVTWLIIKGTLVVPELTLANLHPAGTPAWPVMMVTIACGAISGFHATQSPLMVRTLTSERYMRRVFFGAMLAESFIALVWAGAAMGLTHGSTVALAGILGPKGDAVIVVKTVADLFGAIGVPLILLGVVALPVTTGDTAYRSARLIIADGLGLEQKTIANRLLISVPMFLIGFALCKVDFKVIWQYFAWFNQALSVFTLWAVTVWFWHQGKPAWVTLFPALFMSVAVVTFIAFDPKTGLGLPIQTATALGCLAAVVFAGLSHRRVATMKRA